MNLGARSEKTRNLNKGKFDWLYSSSANLNGQSFDEAWAKAAADEVVDQNFSQNASSKIYKISKTRLK